MTEHPATRAVRDERSDLDLMRAHVAGDDEAFASLVLRHRDRLWAVALRTVRNPEDAADALQDAMLSAFRRAGQYRGDAAVLTWLHRIVVNACLDRLRWLRVRRADPLPDDPDRADELRSDDDPQAEVAALAVRHHVAAALATLNPDQRAALVLVDMQGYSVDDAARMMGCAPGTVKSRCSRGRARLVPLLAHIGRPEGTSSARQGTTPAPDSSKEP